MWLLLLLLGLWGGSMLLSLFELLDAEVEFTDEVNELLGRLLLLLLLWWLDIFHSKEREKKIESNEMRFLIVENTKKDKD